MRRDTSKPVETVVIAGFLGAGKTTLLRGWLAARPAHERWGVLVNEFGALGVDRALIGGDGDAVEVVEIAGGCACCAAQVALRTALTRLLRKGPWDRLLVETTGLGHPAELVDRLRAKPFDGLLDVLPAVAVVDATRAGLYLDAAHPGHERALGQLELARALVVNRVGEVGAEAAAALAAHLAGRPPWPRAAILTSTGRVSLDEVLAALASDTAAPMARPAQGVPEAGETGSVTSSVTGSGGAVPGRTGPGDDVPGGAAPGEGDATGSAAVSDASGGAGPAAAGTGPRSTRLPPALRASRIEPEAAATGWRWPATAEFDRAALQAALERLAGPGGALRACGLLRAKGVFRTARAWYGWQWVDGRSDWVETGWRADNRLEVLVERPVDPQMVEQALRTAATTG